MEKLRVILAAMVTAQILFGFSLTADAAQEVHFSIEKSGNTQGMTFGKSEKIIYVLKSSDSGTVIQLFVDKILKQEYFVWKPGYEIAQPQHPNGITYYDSYLYVVAGENRIFLVKLNEDGTMNSRITCKMIDNNRNTLNKDAVGIASVGNGSFIVRTRTSGGKYNFGLYKFNKTEKVAREDHTFYTSDKADSYDDGQDIGYKKDSSGEYVFFVTSKKIEQSDGTMTCYSNRVIKYKLNKNASGKYVGLTYSKTINLDRPSSSYELFEMQSVDFASSGRMYFAGNERENGKSTDKVRYYY